MNALEKIKKVYHDTYLALQPDDKVEFGCFVIFSYHYEDVFSGGNFQVFHPINNKETLMYECSFEDFDKAKSIYDSMYDVDDTQFSKLVRYLDKQVVRIVKVETLSE
ncbi:TPA: hypothetical protein U2D36_000308 [Streptococcus suis]|nr:hypothetical protein [Streptococcus suis]HEM5125643.1 hypothetical protein [Streptococcus suis]HEM5241107.1 hypothetical protein [Streptococcus suis]HEM6178650.1 hypothetical protein [Streptococcus suis]HEM6355946.1 hypothetical protein [Streptococcus suis]